MNNGGKFQSKDCVIEDCVVEQPDPNSYRESTMMVVSGAVLNTDAKLNIPTLETAFLRNYFNCDYVQNPIQITTATGTAISATKIAVTVTTAQPHGLAEQQWVRISGIQIAPTFAGNGYTTNQDGYANVYNGSFRVSQILSGTQFKYESPDATSVPTITSFEGAWLNRWPSDYIKVKVIRDLQGPVSNKYSVEVETLSPHFLIERGTSAALPMGCVAMIDGISPNSSVSVDTINEPWFVTQWISNTKFRCERDYEGRTPAPLPDPAVVNNFGLARIGARWQAMTAADRIEGNLVRNCTVAGHYVDSFGLQPSVVRDNRYSNVRLGMYVTLQLSGPGVADNPDSDYGMPSIRFISIRTATNPDRWFALFELRSNTTQATSVPRPHFWGVGQAMLIRKATKAGQELDLFNRSFKIVSIPSPEQFEIQLDDNPTANLPDNQPTYPTVNWLWMSRGLVFEKNTVELLPALWLPGANEGVSSIAFSIDGTINPVVWMGTEEDPPWPTAGRKFFRHLSAIFRKNVVRYATLPNGQTRTGAPFQEACVSNQSVESAAVVGNTIDLAWRSASTHQTPLLQVDSNLGYFLNNYSSAARFVPGTDRSTGNRWEGGLKHLVEDAATLGFL